MIRHLIIAAAVAAGCNGQRAPAIATTESVPESALADRRMVSIPEGEFLKGSTKEERHRAYEDYLATSGRDTARSKRWFRHEAEAGSETLPGYRIDVHPVTQAAFAEYVRTTKTAGPTISEADWKAQGYIQHYETEVRRYNWHAATPPAGRAQHPVVLIMWKQASAYCAWRGRLVGKERYLPSADEFEKAARGANGSAYPWGEQFDPQRLNSAVSGPRDTVAVEGFPRGLSAASASGMAGNVFQWTRTPWPHGSGRMTVKGSAWDDWGGLGRAAAAHGRPATARHAIVGFRCAGPLE